MAIHPSHHENLERITPPRDRTSQEVRNEMSGPALRAFFRIAKRWQLTLKQKEGLLGWPSRQTIYNWERGVSAKLSYDVLMRISIILGVYKDLHILYPEEEFADRWIHMNNINPLFGGQSPIEFMVDGGMDAMYSVRRLLDSRRGGWN